MSRPATTVRRINVPLTEEMEEKLTKFIDAITRAVRPAEAEVCQDLLLWALDNHPRPKIDE